MDKDSGRYAVSVTAAFCVSHALRQKVWAGYECLRAARWLANCLRTSHCLHMLRLCMYKCTLYAYASIENVLNSASQRYTYTYK